MATWGALFVILTILTNICALKPDLLHKTNIKKRFIIDSQQIKAGLAAERLSHHVSKRSTSSCHDRHVNTTSNTVYHTQLANDTHGILKLSLKDNKHIVAATFGTSLFDVSTSLYFSSDAAKTFTDISQKIENQPIQPENGFIEHSYSSQVFIITHSNMQSYLWRSNYNNGEINFLKSPLNFTDIFSGYLLFHPSDTNIILALNGDEKLHISKNNGETWNPIAENVVDVKWAEITRYSKTIWRIYVTMTTAQNWFDRILGTVYNNDLKVSDNYGETFTLIRSKIHSFGLQGKFLYISVFVDKDGPDDGERMLEVSTDHGKSWAEVQLPTITQDQFYSILDMSEGMIFLHVDTPGDSGEGTLYVSDSSGIIYSESLRRHLYPNYEDTTDFYKVDSMRGVYITSQLLGDNSIRTMITFDRGGEWMPIQRPEGVHCKDESKECYLQIHNVFSSTHSILASPPLSSENAPGLILVHGLVADSLQMTPPSVFVSSDGGYTWRGTELEGPHHYEIADQGALLLAVPMEETPNVIWFSTDEGICWEKMNFTTESFSFTKLLVEPEKMDQNVMLWGYDSFMHWHIHSIDFASIIPYTCQLNDFSLWTPHSSGNSIKAGDGCLLGMKQTFQRLNQDAWCLINGAVNINWTHIQTACLCTKADFDCDYGYERVESSEECVEDKKFKGPKLDICERGHKYEIISEGYRKVPGDQCNGTGAFMPESKLVDLKKVCKQDDDSILEDQIKDEYLPQDQEDPEAQSSVTAKVLLIVVVATLCVIAALLALYFTRRRILRRRQVLYRYATMNRNDYGADMPNVLATHTDLYAEGLRETTRPNEEDVPSVVIATKQQNGGAVSSARAPAGSEAANSKDDVDLIMERPFQVDPDDEALIE